MRGQFAAAVCVLLGCGSSAKPDHDDAGPALADPLAEWPDPTSQACAGRLAFPNPPAISYSYGGNQLALVDVDGDGNVDLEYLLSDGIHVARGRGDGSFATDVIYANPDTIHSNRTMLVADLDGDGRKDLARTWFDLNSLAVQTNDGAGGFSAPVLYDLGVSPSGVYAADLSGDGRMDIVAVGNTQLSVVLGTATGFNAPQLYAVNFPGRQIGLADVTGDNVTDVVVPQGATIMVFANQGTGTLSAPVSYPTGGQDGIAVVDLDGDGKRDVAVGAYAGSTFSVNVVLNQGNGVFGPATPFTVGAANLGGNIPSWLAAADLDGDGHVDIASPYGLLRNTGAGNLALLHAKYFGLVFGLADLDNDGRMDLVQEQLSQLERNLNNGVASVFDWPQIIAFEGVHQARGAQTTDLDGDGRLDLIAIGTGDASAGVVATRLATGPGVFGPTTLYPVFAELGPNRSQGKDCDPLYPVMVSALADLDNDGRRDLVVFGAGAHVLRANGDGTLGAPTSVGLSGLVVSVLLRDFDRDGFRDLLAVTVDQGCRNPPPSSVRLIRGNHDGTFQTPAVTLWSGAQLPHVAAIDLNGDGSLDLVIDAAEHREVRISRGDGTFDDPTELPGGMTALATRDLDGDGHLDLISATVDGLATEHNNGDGTLAQPVFSSAQSAAYRMTYPVFADLDGNGHVDMAYGTGSGASFVLGEPGLLFTPPFNFSGGWGDEVAVGDVDGDGRVDMLVSSIFGNTTTILSQRCR